jgi:hypothetical protein
LGHRFLGDGLFPGVSSDLFDDLHEGAFDWSL